jgi:hypothetical protein
MPSRPIGFHAHTHRLESVADLIGSGPVFVLARLLSVGQECFDLLGTLGLPQPYETTGIEWVLAVFWLFSAACVPIE